MPPTRVLAVLAVLGAAAAAAGAGCGGSDDARRAAPARAACRLSVDVFAVPAAGVRPRVPARYELARFPGGLAAVDVWALACRRLPLGPAPAPRAEALVLVGAVVADPRGAPGTAPLSPRRFHHYLLWAHAGSRGLAVRLRRAGLPAAAVPGLRTSRGARTRVVDVPWGPSPYRLSASLRGGRDRPHDHRNVWWHDGPDGRTAALELRAARASDVFCPAARCGTIEAAPGGALARVLGARRRRAQVSLDHVPLDPARALLPPRCRRFERDARLSRPCRAR